MLIQGEKIPASWNAHGPRTPTTIRFKDELRARPNDILSFFFHTFEKIGSSE